MKILLDECVTKKLKAYLKEFDVLLTIDKNLIYQQNLSKYNIRITVLNTITSKIEEIIQFIPSFNAQVLKFEPHSVYVIDK